MIKRNKKLLAAFETIFLAMSEEEKVEFTSHLMLVAYQRMPNRLNRLFEDLQISRMSREADRLIAEMEQIRIQTEVLRGVFTTKVKERTDGKEDSNRSDAGPGQPGEGPDGGHSGM